MVCTQVYGMFVYDTGHGTYDNKLKTFKRSSRVCANEDEFLTL